MGSVIKHLRHLAEAIAGNRPVLLLSLIHI